MVPGPSTGVVLIFAACSTWFGTRSPVVIGPPAVVDGELLAPPGLPAQDKRVADDSDTHVAAATVATRAREALRATWTATTTIHEVIEPAESLAISVASRAREALLATWTATTTIQELVKPETLTPLASLFAALDAFWPAALEPFGAVASVGLVTMAVTMFLFACFGLRNILRTIFALFLALVAAMAFQTVSVAQLLTAFQTVSVAQLPTREALGALFAAALLFRIVAHWRAAAAPALAEAAPPGAREIEAGAPAANKPIAPISSTARRTSTGRSGCSPTAAPPRAARHRSPARPTSPKPPVQRPQAARAAPRGGGGSARRAASPTAAQLKENLAPILPKKGKAKDETLPAPVARNTVTRAPLRATQPTAAPGLGCLARPACAGSGNSALPTVSGAADAYLPNGVQIFIDAEFAADTAGMEFSAMFDRMASGHVSSKAALEARLAMQRPTLRRLRQPWSQGNEPAVRLAVANSDSAVRDKALGKLAEVLATSPTCIAASETSSMWPVDANP